MFNTYIISFGIAEQEKKNSSVYYIPSCVPIRTGVTSNPRYGNHMFLGGTDKETSIIRRSTTLLSNRH